MKRIENHAIHIKFVVVICRRFLFNNRSCRQIAPTLIADFFNKLEIASASDGLFSSNDACLNRPQKSRRLLLAQTHPHGGGCVSKKRDLLVAKCDMPILCTRRF
ncbi:hypothetical protein CA13_26260 [Planctomycetes bacterium CA13]|uniref:Uncharacterized protein n=1 Tax=Novipirellula herctigrandis TaxID=2527986 RepID=A0A5C5Z1C2_9BACT|nr:hypothetical protein CA13_26260 [Planctomycetes bacterium CA13]